jgi:argininosuccinate lyase
VANGFADHALSDLSQMARSWASVTTTIKRLILTPEGAIARISAKKHCRRHSVAALFGFMESRFTEPLHFSIAPDGIRYCEVFSRDRILKK